MSNVMSVMWSCPTTNSFSRIDTNSMFMNEIDDIAIFQNKGAIGYTVPVIGKYANIVFHVQRFIQIPKTYSVYNPKWSSMKMHEKDDIRPSDI